MVVKKCSRQYTPVWWCGAELWAPKRVFLPTGGAARGHTSDVRCFLWDGGGLPLASRDHTCYSQHKPSPGARVCAAKSRRIPPCEKVRRGLYSPGPAPRGVAGSQPGAVNGASSRRVAVDRRPTQRRGGCQALLVEPRHRRGGRFRRDTPGLDQPQERQAARREGGRCAREGRERRPPQSQPVLRCPACVGRCVRVRPLLAAL